MGLTVTILGTGTIAVSLERSASAVFVETKNTNMLVDVGPGVMRRLLENGTKLTDIKNIFITHFHPDHTGELAPFIFANKYGGQPRKEKLTVFGGKGIKDFYERLYDLYGKWVTMESHLFDIVELPVTKPHGFTVNDLEVLTAPADHNPESLSARFRDMNEKKDFSVVVSGDTDVAQSLTDLAGNAHVLICECSMPDGLKKPGHMTPSEAAGTAKKAGVKNLILTHLYPESDAADIVSQAKKTFSGTVIKAFDLMKINKDFFS